MRPSSRLTAARLTSTSPSRSGSPARRASRGRLVEQVAARARCAAGAARTRPARAAPTTSASVSPTRRARRRGRARDGAERRRVADHLVVHGHGAYQEIAVRLLNADADHDGILSSPESARRGGSPVPANPAFTRADYPEDAPRAARRRRTHVAPRSQPQADGGRQLHPAPAPSPSWTAGAGAPPTACSWPRSAAARRPDLMVAEGSVVAARPRRLQPPRRRRRPGLPGAAPRHGPRPACARQAVDAAINYVIPLAGHIKGAGGPEPSAGARAFPAVPLRRRARASALVAVLDTGVSAEQRTDGYLAMAGRPGRPRPPSTSSRPTACSTPAPGTAPSSPG